MVRVRERHTDYGANSLDATDDWRTAWERHEREASRGTTSAYETEEVGEPEL